jgi:predicted RNA-binding Zn-ribbon protein involved in translation (DUF1610 family)
MGAMQPEGAKIGDRGRADEQLDALLVAPRRGRRASTRSTELHVCPECGSEFVYPLDWAQSDEAHWTVDLRCPECEWHGSGVYDQEILDRFDIELDAGTAALIDDLTELTRANMEDEAERFFAALREDLLLPEDF